MRGLLHARGYDMIADISLVVDTLLEVRFSLLRYCSFQQGFCFSAV
jgi:hypothetical protein